MKIEIKHRFTGEIIVAGKYDSLKDAAEKSGADLSGADLAGSNLYSASLKSADLTETSLCRADLRNADLRDACCVRTAFRGADLWMAYMWGVDTSQAFTDGADLGRADHLDQKAVKT